MHLKDNDHNLYINYDRFISNILINKKRTMNFIKNYLSPSKETIQKQNKQIEFHKSLPLGLDISNYNEEMLCEGYISPTPNNTTEFQEIKWIKEYKFREDGYAIHLEYRALIYFNNGYSVSIVNGVRSDGNYDEYEIALMDDDGICYHKNVPFDILGYLSKDQVSKILRIVSKLKKIKQ
jgi:hypothetical protein